MNKNISFHSWVNWCCLRLKIGSLFLAVFGSHFILSPFIIGRQYFCWYRSTACVHWLTYYVRKKKKDAPKLMKNLSKHFCNYLYFFLSYGKRVADDDLHEWKFHSPFFITLVNVIQRHFDHRFRFVCIFFSPFINLKFRLKRVSGFSFKNCILL